MAGKKAIGFRSSDKVLTTPVPVLPVAPTTRRVGVIARNDSMVDQIRYDKVILRTRGSSR